MKNKTIADVRRDLMIYGAFTMVSDLVDRFDLKEYMEGGVNNLRCLAQAYSPYLPAEAYLTDGKQLPENYYELPEEEAEIYLRRQNLKDFADTVDSIEKYLYEIGHTEAYALNDIRNVKDAIREEISFVEKEIFELEYVKENTANWTISTDSLDAEREI